MSHFQVEIAELRAKGQEVQSIGERTAEVRYGSALDPMRGAMPGSVSDREVGPLATAWDQRVKDLGGPVDRHGRRMERAADAYQRDEEAAAENLTKLEPPR